MSLDSLSINHVALMSKLEDSLGVISSSIIFLSMHRLSLLTNLQSNEMLSVLGFYKKSRSECGYCCAELFCH